jgi:hypothetical protein
MKTNSPLLFSGRNQATSSSFRSGVVFSPSLGIGPALPPATAAPSDPSDFAISSANDFWGISWTSPYDSSQTQLYHQVRYATGSFELTGANYAASGTLWGDWAGDTDYDAYEAGWLLSNGSGELCSSLLFLTASANPSGDCQFALRYVNANGNLSSIVTASATF